MPASQRPTIRQHLDLAEQVLRAHRQHVQDLEPTHHERAFQADSSGDRAVAAAARDGGADGGFACDAAMVGGMVGHAAQAVQQRAHALRDVAIVDRRAKDGRVGATHLFDHPLQVILDHTAPLGSTTPPAVGIHWRQRSMRSSGKRAARPVRLHFRHPGAAPRRCARSCRRCLDPRPDDCQRSSELASYAPSLAAMTPLLSRV